MYFANSRQEGREVLIVANEDAGSAERAAVDAAIAVLQREEPVELVYTRDRAHLDEVLGRRDGRRLVIAGGDGSLHAVVSALHVRGELKDCNLSLLPLGTGNDLARGLDIPLDPRDAAEVVVSGRPQRMDLLVDDVGGVVVNAVHLGIGARAADAAGALKPRFGRFAYPIGAMSSGIRTRGWRLDVSVDGKRVSEAGRRVLMVGLSNGPSIGGGMASVHPDAVPYDGQAEVVISHAVGPLARIGYAVQLTRGTHLNRRDVQVVQGRQLTVTGDPFLTVADGEVAGPMTHREWTLEPGAWTLSVPPSARSTHRPAAESTEA